VPLDPAMDVLVREVRPDEWRELRELRLAALATDEDAFGDTLALARARDDDAWCVYASDGVDSVTFVAVRDGRFVGMSRGRVHGTGAGLYGMWVAPDARGEGLGRRLVEAVLAWSRARGLLRVVLDAAEHRAPARALYRRCGFVETGLRRPMDRHPGHFDVEMSCPLA
jgi:ribosomal protein S18 acetylase RimI-like enzyme